MTAKRIGVLMGGLSAEREVSLKTGEAVYAALRERGHDVHRVFVDRDIDLVLRQSRIDTAFIALHGRYGEDGCVQGMLEMLGIPYTGSDVLSSALAMNKVKTKQVLRLKNLPTPAGYVVSADHVGRMVEEHGSFGFPVVVKPCGEGSTVGVSKVDCAEELEAAVESALRFDDEVLIERYFEGREVAVAILNDRPLGAIEICHGRPIFDYSAKYASRSTVYHLPPRISPERYRGILEQALAAHRALGLSGATRCDMIVSDSGSEVILEMNSLPGMTPTSLLPKIAHFAGLSFSELCEEILAGARLAAHGFRRYDRRIVQTRFDGSERRAGIAMDPH